MVFRDLVASVPWQTIVQVSETSIDDRLENIQTPVLIGHFLDDWNRPPNFLLVDYYNEGNVNGSVFEVAAQMNNVTWNGHCCGTATSAASDLSPPGLVVGVLLVAAIQALVTLL